MVETREQLKPPEHLTGRSKEWWQGMAEAYTLEEEPHAIELLTAAAVQLARMEQYREKLDTEGAVIRDRFGIPKEHPAAAGERGAANSFRLLVRELGIMPGEPDHNRPPRI